MTQHRLVLLRHAKAEQGGRDRDRELTRRGHADAAAAGQWLVANGMVPDAVVVSPARRTVQTWEAAAEQLPSSADVRYDDRLYDNSVDNLVAALRELDPATTTAILVGHNPSTHALASRLAGRAAAAAELGEFPTATLAVFDLDGEWAELPDVQARLVAVATCRAGRAASE